MVEKLPAEFKLKMRRLLGTDYDAFECCYEQKPFSAFRVNTLKISVEDFRKIFKHTIEPVAWCKDGFYYDTAEVNLSKHPYYHAGLYYIQEPSAMLPACVLSAKPGEAVLDLCAAPGGKTVQIAADMGGEGLLMANDTNAERLKALVKNIELCGVRNILVTNATPTRLAEKFAGYFDKILVDAPCSGEGMFRKDPKAIKNWLKYGSSSRCGIQKEILMNADTMLKQGGTIVYSTCTFSQEENEMVIAEFLDSHHNYDAIDIGKMSGGYVGNVEWENKSTDMTKSARIWPHRARGEGHFVAAIRKNGNNTFSSNQKEIRTDLELQQAIRLFRDFERENFNIKVSGHFKLVGENLYVLPYSAHYPDLSGIKVAKFGWYLGKTQHKKFTPSHAMLTGLKMDDIKRVQNTEYRDALKYLKCETMTVQRSSACGSGEFTAICIDGHPLGWCKQSGQMIKNLYPKGWRIM